MLSNVTAPGVIVDRVISSAEDWAGKHAEVQEAIKSNMPNLQVVKITEGTRGRPVDSIYVLVKPNSKKSKKKLTRAIEVLLKTMFNLVIDYRVVSIK